MKRMIMIILACSALIFSLDTLARCGASNSCGQGYCDSESEYENKCQCTDPSCTSSYGHDCLSKKECCEAFGNIGAR